MGPGVKVGIIAVEPQDYDPRRWWASSAGFRAVTDEAIAYLYARLIFRAFEELQVGGVIAGDIPTWRMDQMPYGGMKDSGVGREGLKYAIEEMTERKLLVMNMQ